jgi:gas vesicle protein
MSIRKEHVEAYDNALNSLQENFDLGKSLMTSQDDIRQKIESGFNLIGNLGQSYQVVSNTKAILNKGSNVVKKVTKPIEDSVNKAKTTNTGTEETPTAEPTADVARTSNVPETTPQLPEEPVGEPTMTSAFETEAPSFSELSPEESLLRGLEASGAQQAQQSSQAIEGLPDFPGLRDSLGPMREMMARPAQGISESQQRIMDFDPENAITDVGNNLSRTTNAVENVVDNVGNTFSRAVPDVINNITQTASKLIPDAGNVAKTLTSTGSSLLSDAGDALDAVAGATLDIPILGEAVALFAGIGSLISGVVGDADSKKQATVQQVGSDFSNSDEHSGAAMSAF